MGGDIPSIQKTETKSKTKVVLTMYPLPERKEMILEERQEWIMSYRFSLTSLFRQFLDDHDMDWYMIKGMEMIRSIEKINKQFQKG